jgi:hypothetical protein
VLEGFALLCIFLFFVLLSLVFGKLVLLTRESFLGCGPNRAQGSVADSEIRSRTARSFVLSGRKPAVVPLHKGGAIWSFLNPGERVRISIQPAASELAIESTWIGEVRPCRPNPQRYLPPKLVLTRVTFVLLGSCRTRVSSLRGSLVTPLILFPFLQYLTPAGTRCRASRSGGCGRTPSSAWRPYLASGGNGGCQIERATLSSSYQTQPRPLENSTEKRSQGSKSELESTENWSTQ